MKFLSLCSGIEAASVALGPLGWSAVAFAEIEPFPSAVLAHHYPAVPNMGDMTRSREWPDKLFAEADAIVGGTPCQAFSVAGKREGLNDARGNLTLTFVEIIDHADRIRQSHGLPPVVVLWENVPGVLSSTDNAFGCLLAGLAGEDGPLLPAGEKWTNAGGVFGPARATAWRILDAQYHGLAQRRRRVFVVASARPGFDPGAVLFEWDGVRRDFAPSREASEDVARTVACGAGRSREHDVAGPLDARANGGFPGTDGACGGHDVATLDASFGRLQGASGQDANHGHSHLLPTRTVAAPGGNRTAGPLDVSTACNAAGGSGRMDFESETFVTHALTGEGFDASEDGTGRGTPLVPVASCIGFQGAGTNLTVGAISGTLRAGGGDRASGSAPCVAFSCKDYGGDATVELAPTLRAMNHADSHPNAGGQMAIAFNWNAQADQLNFSTETTPTLTASQGPAVGRPHMAVRRLIPEECEALQGFPRGYTRIPNWNGWRAMDASETPESCAAEGLEVRRSPSGKWRVRDVDGPRYKALGNSWAVPCVAWIGRRITAQIQ